MNSPTNIPSPPPTTSPSDVPSQPPTRTPSLAPTNNPFASPTANPTAVPSESPTVNPTAVPSKSPSSYPSSTPSQPPTNYPSTPPTGYPTVPTMIPTFEDHSYNNSMEIQIIFRNIWNESDTDINSRTSSFVVSEQSFDKTIQDALFTLKESIVDVRFDLTDIDDIDFDIVNISDTLTIWDIIISFATQKGVDGFEFDLDQIIEHFDSNLVSFWNLTSQGISTLVREINILNTVTTTGTTGTTLNTTEVDDESDDDDDDDAFGVSNDSDNLSISVLEEYYYYVAIGTVLFFVILAIFGEIDARWFRHNELFKMSSILVIAMYFMDVLSDYFFAIQVFLTYQDNDDKNKDNIEFIVFIGTVTFIIIPVITNFVQLHKEVEVWLYDPESRLSVNSWIQNNLRTLYALSILFGSAHSAVVMCNCNIFQIRVFDMGLNRRQRAIFKNKRLFSTVLMENVPQLGMLLGVLVIASVLF